MAVFYLTSSILFLLVKDISSRSADVYVLDVPKGELNLLEHYDDYNPLEEYQNEVSQEATKEIVPNNKIDEDLPFKINVIHENEANDDPCGQLVGKEYNRCKDMKQQRSVSDYYKILKSKTKKIPIYKQRSYGVGHKDPFVDLSRFGFSQDYFDIGDIARSKFTDFSDDYFNGNKFHDDIKFCKDDKGNLFECTSNKGVKAHHITRRSYSSESLSESDESKMKKKTPRKPKRFQVITNGGVMDEDEDISDENGNKVSVENTAFVDKETHKSEESTGNELSESVSVETTTKRSKKNKKKNKELEDFFEGGITAYLQGNKIFNTEDFRRRLPHFLPKRNRWTEDDIRHLSYFWI